MHTPVFNINMEKFEVQTVNYHAVPNVINLIFVL